LLLLFWVLWFKKPEILESLGCFIRRSIFVIAGGDAVLVLIWARILLDLQSPAFIKFNRSNYFVIFEVKLPVEYLSKKATSLRMTDWKKWFLNWKKKNLTTWLKKFQTWLGDAIARMKIKRSFEDNKKNGFLRFVNVCNSFIKIAISLR
jgi:hypothetical protein